MNARLLALGLDLGSTRVKLGALDAAGGIELLAERAAPPVSGAGLIRESDPQRWLDTVRALLGTGDFAGVPLGISSQRSSFVLWSRDDGRPVTPLISWQDRRAQRWCARHPQVQAQLVRYAGLRLSPHYAGPKLASLLEQRPDWRAGLACGELLFGTLDTWLTWSLSDGCRHVTDLSMAARTGMADIGAGRWCDPLLRAFGVPPVCLPTIVAGSGQALPLEGGLVLCASLADQSAGALALLGAGRRVLANFGTGAFVLRVGVPGHRRVPGYLTAVLVGNGQVRYALEGTINGAGPSLDACAPGPTALPDTDPCPGGFALPDRAGIGAPYWRAGVGPLWSADAAGSDGPARRRIMLEGLVFRVREILAGCCSDGQFDSLLLAGGLVRDPALPRALAALLGRPVRVLAEAEAGLIGSARLAAGLPLPARVDTEEVKPGTAGAYLAEKYPRWRDWLAGALQDSSASDSPQ